jgi:ubiquinone/menaquinone biosynthesis C-methylase UbiE
MDPNYKQLNYQPDKYWTKVAFEINNRESKNFLAGDDEPYYRYKRKQFIKLLNEIEFTNKRVLEVGCGPGGNLAEIIENIPFSLTGVDISEEMVNLAKKNLKDFPVSIQKTNGEILHFANCSMDIVLTATVLQHNTSREMLLNLVAEICRVSDDKVILFERIEKSLKGNESCEGRPVSFYKEMLLSNGFELVEIKFMPISVSYYVSGAVRRLFNRKIRLEGEKLSSLSVILQRLTLPVTKIFDKLLFEKRDVARMVFQRKQITR